MLLADVIKLCIVRHLAIGEIFQINWGSKERYIVLIVFKGPDSRIIFWRFQN